MSSEYDLVRSFDIAINTLPILKAVSLAAALSTACGRYSYLEHMCWLWAALYMLLVRSEVDDQSVTETTGKYWSVAGKSKRFRVRLVDPATGRLFVENLSATNGRLKEQLARIYGSKQRDRAVARAQQDAETYRKMPLNIIDIIRAATEHYLKLQSFIASACEQLRNKEVQLACLCIPFTLTLCLIAAGGTGQNPRGRGQEASGESIEG